MKITVYGAGYVGLVTGTCLADLGNEVICVDINQSRVDMLKQGKSPIYEPGLGEILERNLAAGRLEFTTDAELAVAHGELQFIAVGTPADKDGSADLRFVLQVAKTIGSHLQSPKIIINKSTVPVGTGDKVQEVIQQELKARNVSIHFDIVSNPEFLKQGHAVSDFMRPDRIIIGTDSESALLPMKQLYTPLDDTGNRIISMDVHSAELTKYIANAFLATKISFMNEISILSELLNADVENIRRGIGVDPRIGNQFLNPGCGYGGSCFPKDVSALIKTAEEQQYHPQLLHSVEEINKNQKTIIYQKINKYFKNKLKGKSIALWGLAFKPNTDDMREASSCVLMQLLWDSGAHVRAYDPVAMENAKNIYANEDKLHFCDSKEAALQGADALVIVTEWDVFRTPDFSLIKSKLSHPVIFDGRNLFDPQRVEAHGLKYYAIGRGRRI